MSRLDLITLQSIRDADPCADGWSALLKGLGETGKPDLTRVVSLGDIASNNGANDALWATRCLPATLEARRFRVSLILPAVRRASRHTDDARVHSTISVVSAWVEGDDSIDLVAAAEAAEAADAAWAAADAADAAGAAWAAAGAAWAARAAAEAARAAAWAAGAARAAEAAWAAAEAARAAERAAQVQDIIALSPLYALATEGGTP